MVFFGCGPQAEWRLQTPQNIAQVRAFLELSLFPELAFLANSGVLALLLPHWFLLAAL